MEETKITLTGAFSMRQARAGDEETLLSLIRELAVYEEMEDQVLADPETLRSWLFEKGLAGSYLIERDGGEAVGYVIYFYSFSTFLGRSGIYIEDVYIKPAFRHQGIGRAVFAYFIERCKTEGFGRLEWQVLDWNEPSIRFYESLGAKPMEGWTQYRLEF